MRSDLTPNRNQRGEARVDGMVGLQALSAANWLQTAQLKAEVKKGVKISASINAKISKMSSSIDLLVKLKPYEIGLQKEQLETQTRIEEETKKQTLIAALNRQEDELNATAVQAVFQGERLLSKLSKPGNALERYIGVREVISSLGFPTSHLKSKDDKHALANLHDSLADLGSSLLGEFTQSMWDDLESLNRIGEFKTKAQPRPPERPQTGNGGFIDPKHNRFFSTRALWLIVAGSLITFTVLHSNFVDEEQNIIESAPAWVNPALTAAAFAFVIFGAYLIARFCLRQIRLILMSKEQKALMERERKWLNNNSQSKIHPRKTLDVTIEEYEKSKESYEQSESDWQKEKAEIFAERQKLTERYPRLEI